MFDTWGLFALKSHKEHDRSNFWNSVAEAHPRLPDGLGVYIAFAPDAQGELKPWYVGQTYNGFKRRFEGAGGHFTSQRFEPLMKNGPLQIALLALAKDGKPLARLPKPKDAQHRKLINWLEVSLIDTCGKLNEQMQNVSHAKFLKAIWVGGYRGKGALTSEPSYKELAQLLKRSEE